MSDVIQDLKYGIRMLARNPVFAVVVVLVLALGIGANTAIFSVVNAVLLRPLPYEDSGRLVTIWGKNLPKGEDMDSVSAPDFADWRAQNRVFAEIAGSTDDMFTLTGAGDPAAIIAYQFDANFFHLLGVPPLVGRTFLPEEEQPGKNHVVVLNYALWQSRFGGDRGIVGKSITLSGTPYTVIGVMPRSFDWPQDVQLWVPINVDPQWTGNRGIRYLRVMGRLKPGVTIKQAETEMNTIAGRLERQFPTTNRDQGARIITVREFIAGDIRPALLVLLAAVALVLLIACANVANLLLARASARQKEIAVRTALGASRLRIVRQFLTESLLLALMGGVAGLLVAYWGASGLVAMFPRTISNLSIPRVDEIPIDGRVLAFAVLTSLLGALLLGLIPAFQACRLNPNEALKESGRSITGSAQGRRFRSALVVSEVALSLTLLTAAGLLMKSFLRLLNGDLGFRPDHVLTFRILLPEHKYTTDAQKLAFTNGVEDRIKSLPGVQSVGTITFLPLCGWWGERGIAVEGRPVAPERQQPRAVWSSVTPDYFRGMSIPLVRGRLFAEQDDAGATGVAIISASLAHQLWPDEDPIGNRITLEGQKQPREVVGVVGDVRQFGLADEPKPEVYQPYAQAPAGLIGFAVRAASDPMSMVNAVRREVWAVDKDQAVGYLMSMEQLASESLAPQRVSMVLLGFFAAAALMLAAIGLYGVISYAVTQRTHEIGIRMALGADRAAVSRMVLGQGMALTLVGLAIGVGLALLLTRFMSTLLYGVRATDPITFLLVVVVLAAVAFLATYIPARRATRVDPMEALRYE
ncbi:MAG TPA: ABC transporter permease [Terriglobia bacterium]|nr:ABC transporter permease [Terriglobia bacterium]